MEYNADKKEIILDRELNKLDRFALDFTRILEKHVDYVIISGYVSILLGRSRATDDIDIFIKELTFGQFSELYEDLQGAGFECINAESPKEVFSYIKDGLAIRFSRKNAPTPNFEVKFPKKEIDKETFTDFITVILPSGKFKISSLERQIAFKRYYLKSEKDIEDALHIEELFKKQLDYGKINKLKSIIENMD
jgi:hypothetical protein